MPKIIKMHEVKIATSSVGVTLETFNGPIMTVPVDTDMLLVRATKSGSEEQLKGIQESFEERVEGDVHIVTYRAKYTPSFFGLKGTPSVALYVETPKEKHYALNARASNGELNLGELKGSNLTASTSNGPITLTGTKFDSIEMGTSNGMIRGRLAGESVLETSNGNISVEVDGHGDYKIHTSNGNIDMVTLLDTPIKIDARTSNGIIRCEVLNLTIQDRGISRLKARTQGMDENKPLINLRLNTSNGNITIQSERAA